MTTRILSAAEPTIATDFRLQAGGERLVGHNGEINASSKLDLLQQAGRLMAAASEGAVMTEAEAQAREENKKTNRHLIQAAMKSPETHRIVGEKLADNIYMTANRKGIMRRFLNKIDLKQGDIPRFPVRRKNVSAVMLSSSTRLETQIVTDRWLTPPELQLGTRLFVPQNEINQSSTDILEEKFVEGLEAIMVTEDRLYYNTIQQTVGIDNERQVVAGTLTPLALMSARQQVTRWGLKAMYCWMASDLFTDMVGDSSFVAAVDPVARHELVMTGQIATLFGMTLISEAYRHPEHKVLNEGEFFVISDPAMHGAYSDRGGVDSQPIDTTVEKVIGKGWLITESMSMAVANARSVVAGLRS